MTTRMDTTDEREISLDEYEAQAGALEDSDVLSYLPEDYGDRPDDPEGERDARTALESRADVQSLDYLHAKRRRIVAELAPLAALFEGGQSPLADAKRKQHRALVSRDLLLNMQGPKGKEPSETALERMANAHPRHVAFVELLESKRTRYGELMNAKMEVNEQIRNREHCLTCYAAEARLR